MAQPYLQNGGAGRRHKMSAKHSKKNFTKHATHSRGQNYVGGVMRGGIRF